MKKSEVRLKSLYTKICASNNMISFHHMYINYLSSPCRAFSMASGRSDLNRSCVMPGDPRQRVDKRLITVEILGLLFVSGVADSDPGVEDMELPGAGAPAVDRRWRRSVTRPCRARGAGSMPRRVKRSAREAKQRRAPSAT